MTFEIEVGEPPQRFMFSTRDILSLNLSHGEMRVAKGLVSEIYSLDTANFQKALDAFMQGE